MRSVHLHKIAERPLGLVALLALTGGTLVFAQTGGLTGKVTDEKGEVLVGHPIIIERLDIKGTYKTKTDKHGNYIYIGLPIGNYKVTLQDPNGRTIYYFNSTHVGLGEPTQLDFDLTKERALQQKAQQSNPEVQKQLQEQAKEKKELVGLKELYDKGQALNNEKKYAEAAAVFEQALPLAKSQNQAIVMQAAANSYRQARQFDKALEYYQKAIQANPNDPGVHDGLGNLYADMRKVPEAQQEFQKAAELNPPGASREYFNLGAIMYNQGKMDEAAQAFKKATEVDPKFADAFFMEGRALMAKLTLSPDGKVIAAPGTTEALHSYLKLEPNGKYAGEAQAMLQTLQGQVQTEYKVTKKKKG